MKKIFLIITMILLLTVFSGCMETSTEPVVTDPTEHIRHIDRNNDHFCDVCSEKIEVTECLVHMDDDHDGICDICAKNLNADKTLNMTFVLTSKTVSGVDVTDNYLFHYLSFHSNFEVDEVIVDGTGERIKTYNYQMNDGEIVLSQGIYEYHYQYDAINMTLCFNGTIDKRKVVMEYQADLAFTRVTLNSGISFTDELFGDDLNESFYNYCPSAFMEGNNKMHIYYCGNKVSGNVTDYIMYREGTLNNDGTWSFGEKQIALEHGASGTWDSRHACDPSVIKGIFNYQGTVYHYLMAYLGCLTSNGCSNEVGLAVSNQPSGPWVKVGDQSVAFRSYYNSTDYGSDGANYWGYGQPSLLSVDKAGKVLLFYTKGVKLGTFICVEEWNLTDLDNPVLIRDAQLNSAGGIGVFNNADFAYDEVNNVIYTIKEDHVSGGYPSDGGVNWISGSNSIYYVTCSKDDEEFCDILFRNHSWAKVTTIGQTETGYARVHNCGLLTDAYGALPNYEKIGILYTMSELATDYPNWQHKGQWPALHTYRIHGFIIER